MAGVQRREGGRLLERSLWRSFAQPRALGLRADQS